MKMLLTALEKYAQLYGYKTVETPIFEPVETFLTKAGNQVFNRLITFDLDETTMAFRPEFTASIAKQVSDKVNSPKRYQCSGPVFHHQLSSSNDLSQQNFGVELIGLDGVFADAEIIALAALSLENLGITNYQIIVGHVELTRSLLESFGLTNRLFRYLLHNRQQIGADLDSFMLSLSNEFQFQAEIVESSTKTTDIATEKMLHSMFKRTNMPLGSRTVEDIARRLGEKQQSVAMRQKITEAVEFLQEWSNIACSVGEARVLLETYVIDEAINSLFSDWLFSLKLVESYGIEQDKFVIKPDLARSWDYYTGTVFEIKLEDGTHIGGGGRYNDLIRLVNDTENSTPAIGFAFNIDVISSALSNKSQYEPEILSLAYRNGVGDQDLIEWSQELRKRNIPILIDSGKHISSADIVIESDHAIFRGESFSIGQLDALAIKVKGS